LNGVFPGVLSLISNKFLGNIASYGGAIYSDNTFMRLHLANNTFQGNSAIEGGAIYKKSPGIYLLSLLMILFFRKCE